MWRKSSVRHASIIHTTHRHSRGEGEVIFRLFPWPDTAASLHLLNRLRYSLMPLIPLLFCLTLCFITPFSDQLWTICMEFSKSATNFDSPHAESCPNGRRNAEPPKLPALFPNCMHCRLNWPGKGVDEKICLSMFLVRCNNQYIIWQSITMFFVIVSDILPAVINLLKC